MPSLIKRGFVSKLYKQTYAYRIDIGFGDNLFKQYPDDIYKILFDDKVGSASEGSYNAWVSFISRYCDKTCSGKWAQRSGFNIKNNRTIIFWFEREDDAADFEAKFTSVIISTKRPYSKLAHSFMVKNHNSKILVRKTLFWQKYRFKAVLKYARDNIEQIKDSMYMMSDDQMLYSSGWPDTVYLDNDDSATFFMTGFGERVSTLEKAILIGEIGE
jgi:hypothetical protein